MKPILAIVGPTAVGKTETALQVAEELGGEIVNADALQVYRGFDVGTAKPTAEERARARHHLIDILDPHERYSAGEFARRARSVIAEIESRGRRAIVVGGSGLYLRALTEGISPIPPGDPQVRRELEARLAEEGLPALSRQLAELDPETAERLAPGDTQRVLRAIEVALVSGRPLSYWIALRPFGEARIPAIKLGLTIPRSILYDSIAGRAAEMMKQGWLEEVEALLDRGLTRELPAFQAIGYRELADVVEGRLSLEEARERIVRATRRFAKRQLTWFRKEPGVEWFEAEASGLLAARVIDYLRGNCVGGVGDG